MRKYSKHHRCPRSLNGTDDPSNISILNKKEHSAWHVFARNFSPKEIAEIINEKFLDPQWIFIARRRDAPTNSRRSRMDDELVSSMQNWNQPCHRKSWPRILETDLRCLLHQEARRKERQMNNHCEVCQISIAPFDPEKVIKKGKTYHRHCLTRKFPEQKPIKRVPCFFITREPPTIHWGGVAMRYAPLTFTCQGCGRKTKSTSINVTSGYELMLTWKCKRCGRQVKAFLPLERIVTLAPSMQEPDYDKTDMDFLKEMNISLPPPP